MPGLWIVYVTAVASVAVFDRFAALWAAFVGGVVLALCAYWARKTAEPMGSPLKSVTLDHREGADSSPLMGASKDPIAVKGRVVVVSNDDEDLIASLGRSATSLSQEGQWDRAIECLRQAHAMRLKSNFSTTPEGWCRLPLYLQRGGRFEESMAAFDELLRLAPAIARAEAGLDDPDRGGRPEEKLKYYRNRLDHLVSVITDKKALAQKRQTKASV